MRFVLPLFFNFFSIKTNQDYQEPSGRTVEVYGREDLQKYLLANPRDENKILLSFRTTGLSRLFNIFYTTGLSRLFNIF